MWLLSVSLTKSGSDDKTIKIWDFQTAACTRTLVGHTQYVMTLKVKGKRKSDRLVNSSGNYLFSGSWDKTIRQWELNSGSCIRTFDGHGQGIYALKLSGKVIVSCSGDNSLKIWNSETGECVQTLVGHRRHVMSLKISKNKIFSGSSDKTIKVWEPII